MATSRMKQFSAGVCVLFLELAVLPSFLDGQGLVTGASNSGNGNATMTTTPSVKKRYSPLAADWQNAVATFVSFLASAMANAAGVGGGGLYTPMFSILLSFDTKTATALSQAMITGGAATSLMYNIRLRHPHKRKPLIDYDVALMLEPAALLGVSVGVVLNVVLPTWLIVVLLTMLLLYMSWRTIMKGVATYQAETGRASLQLARTPRISSGGQEMVHVDFSSGVEPAAAEVVMDQLGPSLNMVGPNHDLQGNNEAPAGALDKRTGSHTTLMQHPRTERLHRVRVFFGGELEEIPLRRLLEVLVVWLLFLWLQIMKGGQKSPSIIGIRSCQHWFWVLVAAQLPLTCGSTLYVAWRLTHEQRQRRASIALDPSSEDERNNNTGGDVEWGRRELLFYPFLALLAGMLAGLLGIGGGMVLGPLLLELGLLPQVTAATGTLMVLFSSSMAVAQFGILGIIPLTYALYYGGICSVAGYVGVSAVRYAIQRTGRTSVVIIALAMVIATSAIAIAISGSIQIAQEITRGAYMGLLPLCPKQHLFK